MNADLHPDRAVYSISVAADLTDVNPQTLRGYEAKGLLFPHRTPGGTRQYSSNDLDRIRHIATLLAAGVNLTGIRHVLDLEAETADLRAQLRDAQQPPTDNTLAAPDLRSTASSRVAQRRRWPE